MAPERPGLYGPAVESVNTHLERPIPSVTPCGRAGRWRAARSAARVAARVGHSPVRRFAVAAGLLSIAGCALLRGASPALSTPPDAGPDAGADAGAPVDGGPP